jgi:hypothetical protein
MIEVTRTLCDDLAERFCVQSGRNRNAILAAAKGVTNEYFEEMGDYVRRLREEIWNLLL